MSFDQNASAGMLSRTTQPVFDHLGPTIEVLTGPEADSSAPALMQGTIAPERFVPLHSHAEVETFFVLEVPSSDSPI